jgi:hypothetical protein
MLKNKRNIFIAVLFLILLGSIFYYFCSSKKNPSVLQSPSYRSDTPFALRIQNAQGLALGSLSPSSPLGRGGINAEMEIKPVSNIQVALKVLGETYKVGIENGATVYDVMNIVKETKENNFSFISKEYPGLGIFVDEINGIKGTPQKYWIYYVNGKEAPIGISNYILKDGDIINWKQE